MSPKPVAYLCLPFETVALKRCIAFGLQRFRAREYRAIYGAIMAAHINVDLSHCAYRLCMHSFRSISIYRCLSLVTYGIKNV